MLLPRRTSAFLALSLLQFSLTRANPVPAPAPTPPPQYPRAPQLSPRDTCAIPCGYSQQYCCSAGQYCFTEANVAKCGTATPTATGAGLLATGAAVAPAGASVPGWMYWTTTYIRTDLVTVTTVYSSFTAAPVTAAGAAPTGLHCDYASGATPCVNTCCAANQQCGANGVCVAGLGGGSSGNVYFSTFSMTSPPTDTYLAPLRPTGEGSTLTTSITQVGATAAANTASSTVPFLAPIGTANGVVYSGLPAVQTTAQNTLSPGAIAGIVIGVLLGLGLLLTLCFCFCVGEACIGIFGRKDKKKTTVVEEKYTHRSSRRRQGGDDHSDGSRSTTSTESVKPKRTAVFTRFFKSTTRRRTDRDDDRREDGGGGGGGFSKFKQAAGTAAGLATFATVLGVSRKSNKKELIKETVIKETEIRRAPSRSGAGGGAVGAGRGAAGGRGGARGGGGRGRGARSEYTERSDDFSTLSPESESSHGIPNPPRWRDEEIRPPRSSSRR